MAGRFALMYATKSLSHHGYSDARLSMNGSARLAQFGMGSACLIGNAYKVKGIRHQEERRKELKRRPRWLERARHEERARQPERMFINVVLGGACATRGACATSCWFSRRPAMGYVRGRYPFVGGCLHSRTAMGAGGAYWWGQDSDRLVRILSWPFFTAPQHPPR